MARQISTLPVGALVKSVNTKYNDAVIKFIVGHKTANRVKLITEKIITLKCFDASEASNPDSDRERGGNNRYSVSNIDQWLNSAAGPGIWYSARHTYDAPPAIGNVYEGLNEYDGEAGFLSNFEEPFRNAILDTTIRVAKSSVDGGEYEDITRKVYLLSETEVGLGNENGIAEGSKWDLFSNSSDDNSRIAYPTAEAVSRSDYTDESLNASSPWSWWLRTPYADNSYWVRLVGTEGGLYYNGANTGIEGVRPALELDSEILVSDTPDTDGCYKILWNIVQPISALPVGAKIKIPVKSEYQSQFGTNIVFRIADKNHSGYPANSVTLITDKIIQLLAFDGKEPSNANSDRQRYGNNNYNYSNIRQWLNSNAEAGSWYSPKHSADAPPNSSNVTVNAYDARAGFLAIFDTQFVNALMNTTLTVVKNTVTDGGSYETVTDKVFLASTTEVGLANENSIAEGTKLALFTNDASRVAYCTQEAINTSAYTSNPRTSNTWYWWLRTPSSLFARNVRCVHTGGTSSDVGAYNGYVGVRPLCNLPSDLLVSDTTDADECYTLIWDTPPTPPTTLNVPTNILGGKAAVISWNAGSDADGNLVGYELERSINGGDYIQIYKGVALTYTDMITYGWDTVQYRVRSYDIYGAYSSYLTGALKTVINNKVPVISGSDSNLGVKTADFVQTYTVTDPDDGASVTVVEKIDGVVQKTFSVVLGATNTFDVTGITWLRLLNGSHTLTITATDNYDDISTRTYMFTKNMTSFTIQPTVPFEASVMPTRIALSVSRSIPNGATFKVLVCNNANDASPTWEDATNAVVYNLVHMFTNTTKTADTWAVSIKVHVERGTSSGPCYVSWIGGNFE